MTLKELDQQYKSQADERKSRIRSETNKFKRFWKWVWYAICFPYVWVWYNIRDWRTVIIFLVVMLVVGSEVWIPLLLGIILDNGWLLGVAAACEAFWLAPFTPFLPLCVLITIGIKEVYNKRRAS